MIYNACFFFSCWKLFLLIKYHQPAKSAKIKPRKRKVLYSINYETFEPLFLQVS